MKILNKYFSILMLAIILTTLFVYDSKQKKIFNFIQQSTDHVVVLEKIDEVERDNLIKKLKKLTFQDVDIEEKNNAIYVKIKCPPDKAGFFSKWILDSYKGEK